MSSSSLALTERDLDAYLPERASSNAYTRPRLEVKQRATAWAKNVTTRLAEQGFGVEVHATDEHPSLRNKRRVDAQWIFFSRDEEARRDLDRMLDRHRSIAEVIEDPSPYNRHAFLALRIDATAVEVCCAVHPEAKVDIDNLRARLSEGSEHLAEELSKALHALPEQFEIRAGGEGTEALRFPSSIATPAQIAEVLARCASENVPLWIGWRVPRETALANMEILGEQLEDATLALFPVYRLIAWSHDNDHVGIDRKMEGFHKEQEAAHAAALAAGEKWKAEQAAERERAALAARARAEESGAGRKAVTLANLFKSQPAKEAPRVQAPAKEAKPPRAEPRPKPAKEAPKPAANKPASEVYTKREGAEPTWERGAKVGIVAGPFAGKVGTIAEMEGARSARVLLGLLTTRLDISQLKLLDAGRPADASGRKAL
ncbi:MAG: hypothetical protein IPK82_44430 [Polyangiaceae bacterium]|nr:hypothetical protein [Polyangiaceae bacterium]